MNASRTHFSRQIQYHASNLAFDGRKALEVQLIDLITRRKTAITSKQAVAWFRGTDPQFVRDVILQSDHIIVHANKLGRQAANAKYTLGVR